MTIILRPMINEKSMALIKEGLYTFEVSKDATKESIEKAVKGKFNVGVLRVSTLNVVSKTKQQRSRRGYFSQGAMKKAIVKVKKGDKIALFEQAQEEEVEVTTAEGESLGTVKEKRSLISGTKVKIEKESVSKEKIMEEEDHRSAGAKTSQKPVKKGSK